jgi:hypothetical protein
MSRRKRTFLTASATIALSLAASQTLAQESFTWNGGAGTGEDWEAGGNWTGGTGFASVYPGDQAADNANLNVALGGNLGVVIDGKSITLGTLTLGAADGAFTTTVSGSSGLTLTPVNIATVGAAGAVNEIAIDVAVPTSHLTIASSGTNPLTLSGSLRLLSPTAGTFRDVRNESGQRLTLSGPVVLSDNAAAAGSLRFRNNSSSTETVIEGIISDGAATGGRVNYARGTFHIKANNTYTGITQLGENSPNADATHVLYTDQPFGTGRLDISGQSATKTLEGATGLGTRTLGNNIRLSRPLRFAGSAPFVLAGTVTQGNSTTLTNDITGVGTTLTLNGNAFAADSADSRTFTFQGSGTTTFNGILEDTSHASTQFGSLRKAGTGRLIVTNAAGASYGGNTEPFEGVLQLGTGAAPVNIPSTLIVGGITTTGTLELNHNASQTIGATVNGQVNINNVSSGTTILSGTSFASAGTINVDAGTMLINGTDVAGRTVTGASRSAFKTITVDSTAGFVVGQPLTASGAGLMTIAPGTYITQILSPTSIAVNNDPGGGTGASNDVDFRAGTGTGSSNVIVDAGATVGGTGTIGGLLGVNGTVAPGASVGTLTVYGNAIINGTLLAELDATAGTSDLLDVAAKLTLGPSSTLDLDEIAGLADDSAYIIASYNELAGTFLNVTGMPAGYQLDYSFFDGSSANNIAVVPVPEQTAMVLLPALAVTLLRRRHSA